MTEEISHLDRLLEACEKEGISVEEHPLFKPIKGLYLKQKNMRPVIVYNKTLMATADIACVIAEELGHHFTSQGNLVTRKKLPRSVARRQEERARRWAVKEIISLEKIIEAYKNGLHERYEVAEFLGVTEEFMMEAFDKFAKMYGICKTIGNYTIFFDPPSVMELYQGG